MDYYHYRHHCPYHVSTEAKRVFCDWECRIVFPSIAACKEYLQRYCANPQGYKDCTIAQMHERCVLKKIEIQKEVRAWKRKQQQQQQQKK